MIIDSKHADHWFIPEEIKDVNSYIQFSRHLFAYQYVSDNFIKSNDEVLEIGFGEGYGASFVEKYCKHITCIDVEQQLVLKANSKYGNSKIEFVEYDGITFPFKENSFDKIISFQVIEHVMDDVQYLKEAYRVLKPGGVFYFTTPNKKYRLSKNQKPWNLAHIREYTSKDLMKICEQLFPNKTILNRIDAIEIIRKTEINRLPKQRSFIENLYFKFLRKLNPAPILPSSITEFLKMVKGPLYFVDSETPQNGIDLFVTLSK